MKKLIFALGLLFLCSNAWANTCTYIGAGDANASTTTNWSGCGGVAPTTADIVVFDGAFPVTGNDNCTWDITASIASINTTGYTGLVTASVTMTVTGSVTFATGTFAHGNKKIVINNASTLTTNSNTLYDFTVDSASAGVNPTITLGDVLTVNNTLALTRTSGSGFVTVTFNSNSVSLKGDLTMDTAAVVSLAGTSSWNLNGTGTQNINGATSNNKHGIGVILNIDKASGTAYVKNTLVMEGGGGLRVTSGTLDAVTNTSTIYTYNSTAGSITVTFDINVSIYNLTSDDLNGKITVHTLTQALTVANTWTWLRASGFTTYTFNTSALNLQGNITLNTFDTITINGTSAININGGANQAWAGCTSVGNGKGFASSLTINKSALTLTLSNTIPIEGGTFTYTAGTVSQGTSVLRVQTASTLNTNGMSWYNVSNPSDVTVTLMSDLTITNEWLFGNGTAITYNGASYAVNVKGGVQTTNPTSFFSVTGTATIKINGSGSQTINFNTALKTTRYIGNPFVIASTGGTVTFKSAYDNEMNFRGGFTYTSGTTDWSTNTVKAVFLTSQTISSGSMNFYAVEFYSSGTQTITGTVNVAGNVTLSGGTIAGNVTMSGNFTSTSGSVTSGTISFSGATTHTIDGAETFYNFDCPSGETCSFDDADIFTITNGKGDGTWQSDHATNTVDIDFTAETISSGAGTRVDSAGGVAVTTTGTVTDCVNWGPPAPPGTPAFLAMF